MNDECTAARWCSRLLLKKGMMMLINDSEWILDESGAELISYYTLYLNEVKTIRLINQEDRR